MGKTNKIDTIKEFIIKVLIDPFHDLFVHFKLLPKSSEHFDSFGSDEDEEEKCPPNFTYDDLRYYQTKDSRRVTKVYLILAITFLCCAILIGMIILIYCKMN